MNPSFLTIELSEKTAVKKEEVTQDNLMKMKQAGLLVAVDDFGTGYSSLRHLQLLPIDILKIDRSLVSKDTGIRRNEKILEAAVDPADNMGMDSIAEGIETSGQRGLLEKLGCEFGQGFFYDESLTREDLVEKYL